MREIPSDHSIDNTLQLLQEGYRFITNRCERLQSNIFQTRLLLKKTICLRGEEAARVFYDNEKFSRKNAAPKRVQKTLLGEGGVQGLDGETHRQRKQIFMSLMTPNNMAYLIELTQQQWQAAAKQWEQRDRIVLLDAAHEVLCRAVCAWAGVPLPESEVDQRTQDLAAMIDGAGGIGLRYLRARWGRRQTEKWVKSVLDQIRSHALKVPESSAAYAFAWYHTPTGELLDQHAAAVDLINVLRPVVAIAQYITFAALALYQHPECYEKLKAEADYQELFTQEVRRFYPFFPFAAARVKQPFDWHDYHFPEGVQVLLDLYGTNHDPQVWENPEEFQPERFREWNGSSYNFIPQGGGDFKMHHRCAGEWITIDIMKMTLDFLVNSIQYDVPPQNLEMSLSRIPTVPKSGFIIKHVKCIGF
ncbi:MAG TPA: cytochrome P450 [Leptolyngbyaceae cyanobacterium M33_DOE_097]|uniref:Cytochrome P450 n=1 Tax=Oscillatoriales cyanobacterium SpSt-418 TaxID=2282169 RepID=A0A7C3KIX8_9CYAN|nr:cytochrome P450 [Leptolyngbyaceae cyanobacterium M33_DOE_097]